MKEIKLLKEDAKYLHNYLEGRENQLPKFKNEVVTIIEDGDSEYWKRLYGLLGVVDRTGMYKKQICDIKASIRREKGITLDEATKKKILKRIEDKLKKGGESFISPTLDYDTTDITEVIKMNSKIMVRKITPTGKVKIQSKK